MNAQHTASNIVYFVVKVKCDFFHWIMNYSPGVLVSKNIYVV